MVEAAQRYYVNLINEINNIENAKQYNTFMENLKVRNFSTFPFLLRTRDEDFNIIRRSYSDIGEAKEDDFVWFTIKPDETTSILLLAMQGLQKTVLLKRFIYWYWRAQYDCLIFSEKGEDWLMGRRMGTWQNLHPDERPAKLPFKVIVPSFVEIPDHLKNQFTVTSEKLSDYQEMREWFTLGVSGTGAVELLKQIKTKHPNYLADVLNIINSKRFRLHGTSKQQLVTKLSGLEIDKFFKEPNDNTRVLTRKWITRLWADREIPSINMYSGDERYQSTLVGKTIYKIFNICKNENRELGVMPNPKLIVCDDCLDYAKDSGYMEGKSLSVKALQSALFAWRAYGFNIVLTAQTMMGLDAQLVDLCKHIIVSKVGNAQHIAEKTGEPSRIKFEIDSLQYEPNRHIVEYLRIHPDRIRTEAGIPLSPIIKHWS
jgi:hypothetical protein